MFTSVGSIVKFVLYEDEGYVEYETHEQAREAIDRYNGARIQESKILVEWAEKRLNHMNRERRMGGRDRKDIECYNCRGFGHI
ncbi:MAG: hypothetical protein DHS20C13_30330 [Thermodesulfobacteriota bacterium]|nr:MAG: hypothetical protein DHS20C13_30330 [Thermodesulfobacteriota bacterium]